VNWQSFSQLGYKPVISLETADKKTPVDRSLVIKMAIAGFAFGNAMMFAFPEYLNTGSDQIIGSKNFLLF
jgi:Cu+-exporting ATPase